MQSLYGFFWYIFLFFTFIRLQIYFKWNPDHKCSPCPFFTFKGNSSTHFLDQLLCDRHSQACSCKSCATSCMFLCKWFKNLFLECFCDPDSGIPAGKFYRRHFWLIRHNFPAADIDISIFFIIFHCIWQDVHQNTFHMNRTSNKIPVYDFFFFPHDTDILFCCHLPDHNKYFLKNAAQL